MATDKAGTEIGVGNFVRVGRQHGIVEETYPLGAGITPPVPRFRVSFDPNERKQGEPAGGYYTADELVVTAKADGAGGSQPEPVGAGKGRGKRAK